MPNRVVITGVGAWTPLGPAWSDVVEGMQSGRCALQPMGKRMPAQPEIFAGIVGDLKPFRRQFPQVKPPLPSPLARMLLVATRESLVHASVSQADYERVGLFVNRNRGPSSIVAKALLPVLRKGPRKMSPLQFSRTVANAPLGVTATTLGVRGPGLLTMGGGGIGPVFDEVRAGYPGPIVCAGIDEVDGHTYRAAIENGHAAAVRDPADYRPGEPGSSLPAFGEAAAAAVFESYECATSRGVQPRVELLAITQGIDRHVRARADLVGWGAVTAQGWLETCQDALELAGVAPEQVAIHVGGANGHPAVDRAEADGLRQLGREDLIAQRHLPKRIVGETLGAAMNLGLAWAYHQLVAFDHPSGSVALVTNTEFHALHVAAVLRSLP